MRLLGKLKFWDVVKKNVKFGIVLIFYRKYLLFFSFSSNFFNLLF